jgi:hypothetical protein
VLDVAHDSLACAWPSSGTWHAGGACGDGCPSACG